MARKVVVLDDITGEEGAEEVKFVFRGVEYAIDLTDEGEEELGELLAPYTERGRRVGGKATPARPKPAAEKVDDTRKHSKDEVVAVKEFMAKNKIIWSGLDSGAGRIPVDIWRAWRNDDLTQLRPGRLAGNTESTGSPPRRRPRRKIDADQPALEESA